MESVTVTNGNVFGLYELSGDGTVLYSRGENGAAGLGSDPGVIGQDFFHDIARFRNTGDLRSHFRRFLSCGRPVESFLFDCCYDTEIVRTKIFMARGHETDNDHSGGIVIMDIRRPNA